MMDDGDRHSPNTDSATINTDIMAEVFEEFLNDDPLTLADWNAMDVQNSPIAAMNQFLHDGPPVDFDTFLLDSEFTPDEDGGTDSYPCWHHKTALDSVVWALLLKEARNLPSDEKLEFHLKNTPEIASKLGFDSPDDVPRNSTFWRAYADTESNDPRLDEEMMTALRTEARKLVHHAAYVGVELPERAEENLSEFGKHDLLAAAEDIVEHLLVETLPHIAFDRDDSRTTYSLPSIVSFLAHLALEDAYPENGSATFTNMDIYEAGATGADNFYYWVNQRTAEEWFDRFLRANKELLAAARKLGHLQDASAVGVDTTGIQWYGDTNEPFVDGTKPSRNYSYAFHFMTVGIVGAEASLSLAAHHIRNRAEASQILQTLLERVQNRHYFADDQLDVEIERAYLDKGFYGSDYITALRETETDFLIKARKVEPVKDVIDNLDAWDVDWGLMQDYQVGDLTPGTNIFIRRSEKRAPRYGKEATKEERTYGRWVGFVTDCNPVAADRVELAAAFRRRWGVETHYRQFKHEFYPPTKSPKGRARTFHFNLAQLFYNVWVLVNLELRDRYGLDDRRPLTAADVLHAIRDHAIKMDDLPE
jgi:hypothetical protein